MWITFEDRMRQFGFHVYGKGLDAVYLCFLSMKVMLVVEGNRNEKTGEMNYCFYKQTDNRGRTYRKVYVDKCGVKQIVRYVENYMKWLKNRKKEER